MTVHFRGWWMKRGEMEEAGKGRKTGRERDSQDEN